MASTGWRIVVSPMSGDPESGLSSNPMTGSLPGLNAGLLSSLENAKRDRVVSRDERSDRIRSGQKLYC